MGFLRDWVLGNGTGARWVPADLSPRLECARSKLYFAARDPLHNSTQGEVEFRCQEQQNGSLGGEILKWVLGVVPAAAFALFLLLILVILLSCRWRWARKLLANLLGADKPAKLVRFLLRFDFLRRFPLCVYRKALAKEGQKHASFVDPKDRDHLRPLLVCAVTKARFGETLEMPRDLLLAATLAVMREKLDRRTFAGWYPVFLPARLLRATADPKTLIGSLFDQAITVLEEKGDLQGPRLADLLIREGKFILIIQAADGPLMNQLLDAWPGEPFKKTQNSLLVQTAAGSGRRAPGAVQAGPSTAPPEGEPIDPAAS